MDIKLELVTLPVTDTDRARAFYEDQLGFVIDHDQTVHEGLRFVQATPPGSACSIAFGLGITEREAGAAEALICVVADAAAAREQLLARGVDCSELDHLAWGTFVHFTDPDGNGWSYQQLPTA
ncbi:glyoxalase [Nitriliruptoraceae bacterium ZYF776]|nr:glyoxalase [Profundirhabdus halotolerans]